MAGAAWALLAWGVGVAATAWRPGARRQPILGAARGSRERQGSVEHGIKAVQTDGPLLERLSWTGPSPVGGSARAGTRPPAVSCRGVDVGVGWQGRGSGGRCDHGRRRWCHGALGGPPGRIVVGGCVDGMRREPRVPVCRGGRTWRQGAEPWPLGTPQPPHAVVPPGCLSPRRATTSRAPSGHPAQRHARERGSGDVGAGVGYSQCLCWHPCHGHRRSGPAVAGPLPATGDSRPVSCSRGWEHSQALAQQAVQARFQTVVAGGGDGTLNAVASALVGTEVAGGLAARHAQSFCQRPPHPADLASAVHTIRAGCTRRVDVGEANGHIFLNNSSLGLYPRLVRHRTKQQERLGRDKWPAFLWAALTLCRRYPFLRGPAVPGRGGPRRRTPFVFIGNNVYQLDLFNIGARACLDAGAFSLDVVHRTGLGSARRALALRALFGRLHNAKDFDTWCVQEVRIYNARGASCPWPPTAKSG